MKKKALGINEWTSEGARSGSRSGGGRAVPKMSQEKFDAAQSKAGVKPLESANKRPAMTDAKRAADKAQALKEQEAGKQWVKDNPSPAKGVKFNEKRGSWQITFDGKFVGDSPGFRSKAEAQAKSKNYY